MSKTGITRVTVKPGEPLPQGDTDWARIKAMIDEEVVAAALSDPDAQPLTPEQLAKMRRVSRVKVLRHPQYRLRVGEARVFYDVCRHYRRGSGGCDQVGGRVMARAVRKSGVKVVPLSEIKDDLSRYLVRPRRRSSSRVMAGRRVC
jgi:hypothetical protein